MSTVKSYAIGNGDMYYIKHNSDNFTVIDCALPEERLGSILAELKTESRNKSITRFISTHPDQDHISGLVKFDELVPIVNFYCVENGATKESPTKDFERYRELHDSSKAYYIYKGCSRRWMNNSSDERGSSGITVLWPDRSDLDFQSALDDAADGLSPNNISPIVKYSLDNGVAMLWMGDLETDFMEKLVGKVNVPRVDVLFAPHHGRTSGKVPRVWLESMSPGLIVIGEAPSEYLDYYAGYDVLTQNSTGDILFENEAGRSHVYAAESAYVADFLDDEGLDHKGGLYYIGTLQTGS